MSHTPSVSPRGSHPSQSAGQSQPLRYALYVRKSTEEDERQSQSIDSQTEQSRELARRSGLNVTAVF